MFAAVNFQWARKGTRIVILFAVAISTIGCQRQIVIHNFLGAAAGTGLSGVRTFVMQGETTDCINLAGRGCERPAAGHNCLPTVPPEPHEDGPSAGSADEVVTGYDYWRNTTDSCTDSRVRAYRGLVGFDIGAIGVPEGGGKYLTSARLDFDASQLSSGDGQANRICASEMEFVTVAWQPGPVTELNFYTQRNDFPSGASTLSPILLPLVLPASDVTTGVVQVSRKGHFRVDVTPYVKVWLDQPNANHGITFVARDERFYGLGAPPPEKTAACPVCGGSPTPLNATCHTHFSHFFLTVDTYMFQPRRTAGPPASNP